MAGFAVAMRDGVPFGPLQGRHAMSPDRLRKQSRKQLESLARRQGIANSRTLRKGQLIDALSSNGQHRAENGAPRKENPPAIAGRLVPDQLEVATQDLHWLRVGWEIGRASLDRAAAALGPEWHRAVAVLRLVDVAGDEGARGTPRIVQEINLPSGQSTWFVRVENPDRSYRVSLGFRAHSGRFHQVIQSRPVTPAQSAPVARPHARNAARVEDANGLPLDLYAAHWRSKTDAANAAAAEVPVSGGLRIAEAATDPSIPALPFEVEAELVVRGAVAKDAKLTLLGRPLTVSRDGRFCQRVPLQTGRQVVPVVATAGDHTLERTVVLALELSARELEPRIFDEN
jgi:hypothetical protein